MKIFTKKIIPYFLVLIIVFFTVTECYFSVPAKAAIFGAFDEFYNGFKTMVQAFVDQQSPSEQETAVMLRDLCQGQGFIADVEGYGKVITPVMKIWGDIAEGEVRERTNAENIQAIKDMLEQHVHFDDNNKKITLDNQVKTAIKNTANYIINLSPEFYAYSLQLEKNVTNLPANSYYSKTRDFIKSKQDSYRCNLLFNRSFSNMRNTAYDISDNGRRGYVNMIVCIPKSINLVYRADHGTYFDLDLYDNNWNQINYQNMISKGCKVYLFNKNTEEFEENTQLVQYFDVYFTGGCLVYSDSGTMSSSYGFGSGITVTSGGVHTYKVYRTLDDLKRATAGASSYYLTNNWTNFINNSGDTYTIDNSNVNKVTYGDIITYIDNHYEDEGDYPTIEDIKKWIDERNTEPEPTPTPTPTPVFTDPTNPYPTGVPYPTTNPHPTESPDDFDPWDYPTVSGNGDDSSGWSFWDFLKAIVNALSNIVNGIKDIFNKIADWFSVDTVEIKDHVSGVIDGSVPLPNGVSYNGIANEIIPVEDIKSIGKAFTDIPDGFVPGTYYPKLTIKTPQIIRQFYDEEEIILLDFEEWASTFVIVRTLLEFSFWLAEIYYLLSKLRPVISIS